uniref:Src like adaptor 2 n=1 Tax=Chrysolophus pictus TaxID=9089 RepID=A0A8C3LR55_CHRPC
MGILPSREKPLSAAPSAAVPAPSPLPTQAAPGGFQALALCDFPSGAGATAVLRMGEQLHVLSEDGEWWLVASQVSGKECLIPSSCVAKVRHRWLYEGVSREKAEELLLQPGNHSGAFLIRESQTRRGGFSLSVRRTELASWDAVTHYRIHRLENGWLYISPRLTFPSLHDLVEHYSGKEQQRSAQAQRRPWCRRSVQHRADAAVPAQSVGRVCAAPSGSPASWRWQRQCLPWSGPPWCRSQRSTGTRLTAPSCSQRLCHLRGRGRRTPPSAWACGKPSAPTCY